MLFLSLILGPWLVFLANFIVFLIILKYGFKLEETKPLTLLGMFIVGGFLASFAGSLFGSGILGIIMTFVVFLVLIGIAFYVKYKLNFREIIILLLVYAAISSVFFLAFFYIVLNRASSDIGVLKSPVVSVDICKEFPANFISLAINRQISKIKPTPWQDGGCQYYTADTGFLPTAQIRVFNKDYVKERLNLEKNFKLTIDQRIKSESYIQWGLDKNENNIISINLMINPNKYLEIFSVDHTLTNEEIINLAVKVAEVIPEISNLK